MSLPQRSWWLKILDETNKTVIGVTAIANLYTFSAGVAYFTTGAIFCSLSVKFILKKLIQQPRPPVSTKWKKTHDYGMPSTHSASISYYFAYIWLASCRLPIHSSLPQSILTRILPPLIVTPWALAVLGSRVWLGHHSWPQVYVGAAYGISFSFCWFLLWSNGLSEPGNSVEDYVVKYL
ncbi:hypothetical protein C8J56DRAFT_228530 [Mycena floridula]|nr:hypothetical protein C8J56DRAFT_228530 [Mycena floridula]